MTIENTSIQEIQDRYDTYLVDMVGVIYDGLSPFEEAIQALNSLIVAQKRIIFVSNNPRPSSIVSPKLEKFGIRKPYDLVTSGDLMRYRLTTDLAPLTFYHFCAEKNPHLLEGLSIKITSSLELADAVILSGFLEEQEDITRFDDELKAITQSGKPVYCPNPDRRALHGDSLRYTAGFFADKMRAWGGHVTDIGKPSIEVYQYAVDLYASNSLNKQRTLMIGDTLETDIQGAIDFGIDSLLVLSGIAGMHLPTDGHIDPTYLMPILKS